MKWTPIVIKVARIVYGRTSMARHEMQLYDVDLIPGPKYSKTDIDMVYLGPLIKYLIYHIDMDANNGYKQETSNLGVVLFHNLSGCNF